MKLAEDGLGRMRLMWTRILGSIVMRSVARRQKKARVMSVIENEGQPGLAPRLRALGVLTPGEFHELAERMATQPAKARKTGFISARQAHAIEAIETRWNGKETANTAKPGDWIATNLARDGQMLRDKAGHANVYVIEAKTFDTLYEPAPPQPGSPPAMYRAKGVVEALYFSGGFDIMAPWGQQQVADAGYLILNGQDVYGNNKETFEATYELL